MTFEKALVLAGEENKIEHYSFLVGSTIYNLRYTPNGTERETILERFANNLGNEMVNLENNLDLNIFDGLTIDMQTHKPIFIDRLNNPAKERLLRKIKQTLSSKALNKNKYILDPTDIN